MSKLDTSKNSIFWQLQNIQSICSTKNVLKFDKSNEVNAWQDLNIDCILVTEEVSIPFILISFKSKHSLNINDISSTFEVSKLDKSILFIFFNPLNIFFKVCGEVL